MTRRGRIDNGTRYRRVLAVYQQTSRDAYESVWATLPNVDAAILRHISAHRGATSNEIEAATGLRHQTVSAQIRHMVEGGLLADYGERRENASGRRCIVWKLRTCKPQVIDGMAQGPLFDDETW